MSKATKFKITRLQERELREIGKYVEDNFSSEIPLYLRQNLKAGFKSTNELFRLGALFGYKERSVYTTHFPENLSGKSLSKFSELLGKLPAEKAKSIVDRFEKLKGKILLNALTYAVRKDEANTLQNFVDTKWYCYERTLNGIGRKSIEFDNKLDENKKIKVTVYTTDKKYAPWTGIAYCDITQDYLLIETTNSVTQSDNTNYMIRIEKNCIDLTLCVGHVTFQHANHKNVVTKTVLLEKILDKSAADSKEFDLSDNTKNEIGEEIYKFLFNRDKNRLSSPHDKIIINKQVLKEWHASNDIHKLYNRNNHLIGEYDIFYAKDPVFRSELSGLSLTKDTLTISENSDLDLIASYTHEIEKDKPIKWQGDVNSSQVTKVVTIFLHGPYLDVSNDVKSFIQTDKPICLVLNIPVGERPFDTLAGIVTGVSDDDLGVISLLVVAVKKSTDIVSLPDYVNQVESFFSFYAVQSWIKPPEDTNISRFDDLQKSTIESGKRNRITFKYLQDKLEKDI